MATLKKIGKMWYSDLRMGGKRVRRALSIYPKVADQMLADMVDLRKAQKHGNMPKQVSYIYFRERYRDFCRANKATQTQYRDDLAFRMMEKTRPVRNISEITPEFLESLKARWKDEGKTLSVVTRAIKSIKTAMRRAEEWKFVTPQNWRSVKVVEPRGRLLYYSMEEYGRLLKICRGNWLTAALLMGRAGLRSGEAYHLEWQDVDFSRHRIWIHTKEGWSPKGSKERFVDMQAGGDLEAYLRSIARPKGFVLGPDRMTHGSFLAYFTRLIRKAGLKGSPHTLRHTFASHLVSAGASLEWVGELLGHGNPRTTKIYAHLMPHATQNAIKLLPKLLSTFVPVPDRGGQLTIFKDHRHPRHKQAVSAKV